MNFKHVVILDLSPASVVNHKLIKHKFAMSGMVDGYSRLIMWIKVNNNNRAQTTCNIFKNIMQNNTTPLQVAGDCGAENRLIAKHMILLRSKEPCKGHIGGKSTCNTRIERLRVDYNKKCDDTF